MLTDEQKKQRLQYVTGSDTSAIVGVSPWKTAFDVWREKLGLVEAEDISDKPHVKAGTMLEPAIRNWFAHETGLLVTEPGDMIVSDEYPWMAGNLDGWIPKENAVLEVKTARSNAKWGDEVNNIIPLNYLCQVAHYCIITGAEKAYVAVLFAGQEFRIYQPRISQALKDKIIERTRHFWEYNVKREIPPEPTSYDEVKKIFPTPTSAETVVGLDVVADANLYKKLSEDMKEFESMMKDLKNKIAVSFGENDRIVTEDGHVVATFKQNKPSMTFDKKLFEKENPELYAKYVLESAGSRRLLVK